MTKRAMALEQLLKLNQQLGGIFGSIEEKARIAFPVGALVEWKHHGYSQSGQIVRNMTYRDDVRLECTNARTGRKVIVRWAPVTGLYGC